MADKINPRIRIVSRIRHNQLPPLQRPILNHPTARHRVPIQLVLTTKHSEVREADLVGVSVDDGRQPEVAGVDGVVADVQLEVAAVVELAPLQLAVVFDQVAACVVGGGEGDVLPCWTGARDCGAGEFDTLRCNSKLACSLGPPES